MVDIDIVIAHRGPEMGLWMTLASCAKALGRCDERCNDTVTAKFYVVSNGNGPKDWATDLIEENLKKTPYFGGMIYFEEPLSPPAARNLGAMAGKGDYIFFLDNHCIVDPAYFYSALDTLLKYRVDAVHSVTKFWVGESSRYHYRLTLERNFWGYQVDEAVSYRPYAIAAGCHGGFAVKRSVWEELGGYWDGFEGYGGEEMYWELLMGLTDKRNFLNPDMIHWHHPGIRPYERDKSLNFIKNMMMSAYIIGGERWLERTTNGLAILESRSETPRQLNFGELKDSAKEKAESQRKFVEGIQRRTLNEQLLLYSKNRVAQ